MVVFVVPIPAEYKSLLGFGKSVDLEKMKKTSFVRFHFLLSFASTLLSFMTFCIFYL